MPPGVTVHTNGIVSKQGSPSWRPHTRFDMGLRAPVHPTAACLHMKVRRIDHAVNALKNAGRSWHCPAGSSSAGVWLSAQSVDTSLPGCRSTGDRADGVAFILGSPARFSCDDARLLCLSSAAPVADGDINVSGRCFVNVTLEVDAGAYGKQIPCFPQCGAWLHWTGSVVRLCEMEGTIFPEEERALEQRHERMPMCSVVIGLLVIFGDPGEIFNQVSSPIVVEAALWQ